MPTLISKEEIKLAELQELTVSKFNVNHNLQIDTAAYRAGCSDPRFNI